MSADNWTVCPQCKKKAEKDFKDEQKKVNESYGKVSADEYLAMLPIEIPNVETDLREDYEVGIIKGVFKVKYKSRCEECGFTYNYSHSGRNFTK